MKTFAPSITGLNRDQLETLADKLLVFCDLSGLLDEFVEQEIDFLRTCPTPAFETEDKLTKH